ncbi:MAG: carboxypeptidase regulatory-like domain-containing protein [Flavobacteriales bacterium]|nr:carboxypeptidase regulatory-like domain-containing protein [Flavobacteriales bacterium]
MPNYETLRIIAKNIPSHFSGILLCLIISFNSGQAFETKHSSWNRINCVCHSRIKSMITDEDGNPIFYTEVFVLGKKTIMASSPTDFNGRSIVSPLGLQQYKVVAVKYGYAISEMVDLTISSCIDYQVDFKLRKLSQTDLEKTDYSLYLSEETIELMKQKNK